jgi:histidinol dehydrogenase
VLPIIPWSPGTPCARLDAIRSRLGGPNPKTLEEAARIIERVRRDGDRALIELTREFDGIELTPATIRLSRDQLQSLAAAIDPKLLAALEQAADNIRSFHRDHEHHGQSHTYADGSTIDTRVLPIGSVGVYVPGGSASYPSALLMSAIPAVVAGVDRITAVTPPQALARTPALAAALLIAGVDDVYQIGGAQAVAALAYGTESIKRVHKIVGPGNRWVSAAKQLVHGVVGVDAMAGPSEVVVLADEQARPSWVAADLVAQAEHGPDTASIAIVGDLPLAEAIQAEVESQVARLPRAETARVALDRYGAIFHCVSVESACRLINILAPEHLQLLTVDAEALLPRLRHAGAIFLGHYSPQAVGNYLAGPSCVLPTSGASRFSSPLGLHDFVKRTHVIRWTASRLAHHAGDIVRMARAEGCEGHAESVQIRLEGTPGDES